MTAPERPAKSGLDTNARGIIVLAVVVVLGVGLLWQAGDDSSSATATTTTVSGVPTTAPLGDTTTTSSDSSSSSTSSSVESSDTTTSTTEKSTDKAHAASSVKVVVLNGSGKAGVAGSATGEIKGKGFTTATPGNAAASAKGKPTTVYHDPEYAADATLVAAILGKSTTAPKPASTLGPGSEGANVVVVLGTDTAPASGSSTTTTR